MYQIYIENYTGAGSPRDRALFDSSDIQNSESDRTVLDPTVKNTLNKAGSLEFTVLPQNPYYDRIRIVKSIFTVYLDGTMIFRGRVMSYSDDIYRRREVFCEGELAYLNDSLQPPKKESKDRNQEAKDTAIDAFFGDLIVDHNAQMRLYSDQLTGQDEDDKCFEIGTIAYPTTNAFSYRTTGDNGEVIVTDEEGNYASTADGAKESIAWEIGGIRNSGENQENPLRIRMQNAVFVRSGSVIIPNSGYEYSIYIYSSYENAQNFTLKSRISLTDQEQTIDEDCYVRLVIRRISEEDEAEAAFTAEDLETVPGEALILSGLNVVWSKYNVELTVATPFNNTSYRSTFDALQNDLIDVYGGYVSITYQNGVRYLNYTEEPIDDGNGARVISFGVNLQEITKEVNAEDLYTVLLPTGDNNLLLKQGKAATIIQNVNYLVNGTPKKTATIFNSKDFYVSPLNGIRQYGPIFKTQSFSGISKRDELKHYAENYISKTWKHGVAESYTVKAVDMHYVDDSNPLILIGTRCRITMWPDEIIQNRICTEATYALQSPGDNEYVFEDLSHEREGLTSKYKKQSRSSGTSAVSNTAATEESSSGDEDTIIRSNGNIIFYPGDGKFVSIPLAKEFLAPSLTRWSLGPVTYSTAEGFQAASSGKFSKDLHVGGKITAGFVGVIPDSVESGQICSTNGFVTKSFFRGRTIWLGATTFGSMGQYNISYRDGGIDGGIKSFHPVKLTMLGENGENENPTELLSMWVLGENDVNFNIAESKWFKDRMDSASGSVGEIKFFETNSERVYNASGWTVSEGAIPFRLTEKYLMLDVMDKKNQLIYINKVDASGLYERAYSTAIGSVHTDIDQLWTFDEDAANYSLQVHTRWTKLDGKTGEDANFIMLPDIRARLDGGPTESDIENNYWNTTGADANKYVIPMFKAKAFLEDDMSHALDIQNGRKIVINPTEAMKLAADSVGVSNIEQHAYDVLYSANLKKAYVPVKVTLTTDIFNASPIYVEADISEGYDRIQKLVAVGNPTWNELTGDILPSYRTAIFQTNVEDSVAAPKEFTLYLKQDTDWNAEHKKYVYISPESNGVNPVARLEIDASGVFQDGRTEGSGASQTTYYTDGFDKGQRNARAEVSSINHTGGAVYPSQAHNYVYISLSATSKLVLTGQDDITETELPGNSSVTAIEIPLDPVKATLKRGSFTNAGINKGSYTIKGSGGKVRIDYTNNSDGAVVSLNPENLKIDFISEAKIDGFVWHGPSASNDELKCTYTYNVTAYTKSEVDGKNEDTMFNLSFSDKLDPYEAIGYGESQGFKLCHDSIGIYAPKLQLSPGESIDIYPTAKASRTSNSASNITSKKITISAKEATVVSSMLKKTGWVAGSTKFTPDPEGDLESYEVKLSLDADPVTGQSAENVTSVTIKCLDGDKPTGADKTLYLQYDEANSYVYLKKDAAAANMNKNVIAKRKVGTGVSVQDDRSYTASSNTPGIDILPGDDFGAMSKVALKVAVPQRNVSSIRGEADGMLLLTSDDHGSRIKKDVIIHYDGADENGNTTGNGEITINTQSVYTAGQKSVKVLSVDRVENCSFDTFDHTAYDDVAVTLDNGVTQIIKNVDFSKAYIEGLSGENYSEEHTLSFEVDLCDENGKYVSDYQCELYAGDIYSFAYNKAYNLGYYYISQNNIVFRKGPSSATDAIGTFQAGAEVQLINDSGTSYWRVKCLGYEGYVSKNYLVSWHQNPTGGRPSLDNPNVTPTLILSMSSHIPSEKIAKVRIDSIIHPSSYFGGNMEVTLCPAKGGNGYYTSNVKSDREYSNIVVTMDKLTYTVLDAFKTDYYGKHLISDTSSDVRHKVYLTVDYLNDTREHHVVEISSYAVANIVPYSYTATVVNDNGTGANIYSVKKTDSAALCQVPNNETAYFMEDPNGYSELWIAIKYGETVGYMESKYVVGTEEYNKLHPNPILKSVEIAGFEHNEHVSPEIINVYVQPMGGETRYYKSVPVSDEIYASDAVSDDIPKEFRFVNVINVDGARYKAKHIYGTDIPNIVEHKVLLNFVYTDGREISGKFMIIESAAYKPTEYSRVSKTYAKTGSTVSIRTGPSKNYPVVASVPIGAIIYLKKDPGNLTGDWAEVKYNDAEGYMMTQFIVGTPEYNEYTIRKDPKQIKRATIRNIFHSSSIYDGIMDIKTVYSPAFFNSTQFRPGTSEMTSSAMYNVLYRTRNGTVNELLGETHQGYNGYHNYNTVPGPVNHMIAFDVTYDDDSTKIVIVEVTTEPSKNFSAIK